MSKTMTATSHDASKGKHKKWGKSRSDDDPSDREFMNVSPPLAILLKRRSSCHRVISTRTCIPS